MNLRGRKARLAAATAVAVVGAAFINPSAAFASGSVSCTTAQNGRTITFICNVSGSVRPALSLDCDSKISWVLSYTELWRSPSYYTNVPLTRNITCAYSFNPVNPGWGTW
jgi:hypothetical protein